MTQNSVFCHLNYFSPIHQHWKREGSVPESNSSLCDNIQGGDFRQAPGFSFLKLHKWPKWNQSWETFAASKLEKSVMSHVWHRISARCVGPDQGLGPVPWEVSDGRPDGSLSWGVRVEAWGPVWAMGTGMCCQTVFGRGCICPDCWKNNMESTEGGFSNKRLQRS